MGHPNHCLMHCLARVGNQLGVVVTRHTVIGHECGVKPGLVRKPRAQIPCDLGAASTLIGGSTSARLRRPCRNGFGLILGCMMNGICALWTLLRSARPAPLQLGAAPCRRCRAPLTTSASAAAGSAGPHDASLLWRWRCARRPQRPGRPDRVPQRRRGFNHRPRAWLRPSGQEAAQPTIPSAPHPVHHAPRHAP